MLHKYYYLRLDSHCDINHSPRIRQSLTLDFPRGKPGQCMSHMSTGSDTRQGCRLRRNACLLLEPVSSSQLNKGDLNQQAEPHTSHFSITVSKSWLNSFLFTELCKTHSWSYSRATSERLWKHSPADHLGLRSKVFYRWLLFLYYFGIQKLRCALG